MKLKAFRFHQKMFTLIGICEAPDGVSRLRKAFYIFNGLLMILVPFVSVVSSAVYLYLHINLDLINAITALVPIMGSIGPSYKPFITMVRRQRMQKLFELFQTFYDKCG